jgi:hypothetical protein
MTRTAEQLSQFQRASVTADIVMIFKQKPSPAPIPVRAFLLGDFSYGATTPRFMYDI